MGLSLGAIKDEAAIALAGGGAGGAAGALQGGRALLAHCSFCSTALHRAMSRGYSRPPLPPPALLPAQQRACQVARRCGATWTRRICTTTCRSSGLRSPTWRACPTRLRGATTPTRTGRFFLSSSSTSTPLNRCCWTARALAYDYMVLAVRTKRHPCWPSTG
ncbi:hypothetical protein CLOM_g144 [Closterium sp. NIES-68]|nr:hypothetical protein CLOM_g144 [Closterium sp. NIES-68]